jgi:MFS family permease
MGDATLYAVLPTHSNDAGIALAMVGVILSANRFIRLATNGPAGWLYDRWDRRKIFIASLWIGVASTVICAATVGLAPLVIARLLWGLAWSGIWVGGNAIVLQVAPEAERGRWVGVYQVWFFGGSSLGSLVGGMLTDAVGYRDALWIGAGISALGAIAAMLGMPRAQGQPGARAAHSDSLRGIFTLSARMWATIIAHGINRLIVAGVVSATMGLVVRENFSALPAGIASITGGLLAARTLIGLIGAPLAGARSDRIGSRWGLLAFALALGAIGIGLFGAPNIAIFIGGMIAGSLASGAIQTLVTALVGDLSDRAQYGKNMGVLHTAGDLGSAIGPLVAYAILPFTGLTAIFFACAAMMLFSALWALAIARSGD